MEENDQEFDALVRLASTDPDALGRLLERYRAFLWFTAHREFQTQRAGDCDTSGIVQQTLTEAFQSFQRFTGSSESQFSAWINQIHRNNILDNLRRVRPGAVLSLQSDDTASFCWIEPAVKDSTPSQIMIQGERALRLAERLLALPEMQREAIWLRYLEGWSTAEIAQHLNKSITATAGLIKRGLKALREKMSEESWL